MKLSAAGSGSDQDWYVDGSDDEKYNPGKIQGVSWQPMPNDIIGMFEHLSKDKAVLELKWQCPGRKSPESEKESEEEEDEEEQDDGKEEVVEEEVKAPEPSAFDFDDSATESTGNITPRRISGSSKTPRTQKRVARMDKVLDDIRRQQLERAALKEARRAVASSPGESPGSARFRLGMTGTSISETAATSNLNQKGTMKQQIRTFTASREGGDRIGSPSQLKWRSGLSPKVSNSSAGSPANSPSSPSLANRQSPVNKTWQTNEHIEDGPKQNS